MITIDITLLIQLANFIIALVGLNYLLIRPIRAIVKERRALAAGLIRESEGFTAGAREKLDGYEASLAEAREEAAREREAAKAAAIRQEGEILAAAQAEAAACLRESRESTRSAVDAVMKELSGRIPGLAAEAAARLTRGDSPSGRKRARTKQQSGR